MSTRFDPDELRDLEHRLTERLETLAPFPRPAAAERVRAEISVTAQRRGPASWLRARMPQPAWTRIAAVSGVAVAALVVGIGIGTSGILPVGKSPRPSPSGVVTSPAPFGEAWQQVVIEAADTPGDYVVEGGYAGETRTVLVGMIAGPAAQAAGATTPAAWYSDDGVTWQRSRIVLADGSSGPLQVHDLNVVFAAGDRLLAFGSAERDSGGVLSEFMSVEFESTDGGATWSQITTGEPPTGGFVRDVSAGGPGYVAVGDRGSTVGDDAGLRIWTSTDGLTWSRVGDPEPGQPPGLVLASGGLSAVAAHDGVVVATGTTLGASDDNGLLITSTDGVRWDPLDLPGGFVPEDVTFAHGAWIVTGRGFDSELTGSFAPAVLRSLDGGSTWEQTPLRGMSATHLVSVASGAIGMAGVSDGLQQQVVAWTSGAGVAWTGHRLPNGPFHALQPAVALATPRGLLVAGNGRNANGDRLPVAWFSPTGPVATPPPEPAVESSTPEPSPTPTPPSSAPLPEPPVFADWTRIDLPDPAPNVFGGSNPVGVVRFGDRWIAAGSVNGGCCDDHYSEDTRGVVWTSADGRSWELLPPQASLAEATIGSMATNGAVLVAVGSVASDDGSGITRHDPAAWISANGTTWERVPGVPALQLVAARGSGFVAVSSDPHRVGFYASPDGRSWDVTVTADYPDPASARVLGLAVGPGGAITAVGEETTVESGQSVTRATEWTTPDPQLGLSVLNPADDASMQAITVVDGVQVALGTDLQGELLAWLATDGLDWSNAQRVDAASDSLSPLVALAAGSDLVVAGHVSDPTGFVNGAVWVRSNGDWYRVDGTTAFAGLDNEIFGMAWDPDGRRVLATGFHWDENHARPAIWIATR